MAGDQFEKTATDSSNNSKTRGVFQRLLFSLLATVLTLVFFWRYLESPPIEKKDEKVPEETSASTPTCGKTKNGTGNDNSNQNKASVEAKIDEDITKGSSLTLEYSDSAEKETIIHQLVNNASSSTTNSLENLEVGDLSNILLDESYLQKTSLSCDDSLDTITEDEEISGSIGEEEDDDVFDEKISGCIKSTSQHQQSSLSFISNDLFIKLPSMKSAKHKVQKTEEFEQIDYDYNYDRYCSRSSEVDDYGPSEKLESSESLSLDSSSIQENNENSSVPSKAELIKQDQLKDGVNSYEPQLTSKSKGATTGKQNEQQQQQEVDNAAMSSNCNFDKQKKFTFVATAQSKAILTVDKSPTFQIDDTVVEKQKAILLSPHFDEAIAESVTEGENPIYYCCQSHG